ncbi:hypothetical protein ACWFR4_47085, partial [Streptomyces sp. NPDC055140]
MRVLIVEDEPFMAEAIRDGLRLEAIAADIAGDGDTALELVNHPGLKVPGLHNGRHWLWCCVCVLSHARCS